MVEQYSSHATQEPMSLTVVRRAKALSTRVNEASQAASSCSGFPGHRACGEGSSLRRSKRSWALDNCWIGSLEEACPCIGTYAVYTEGPGGRGAETSSSERGTKGACGQKRPRVLLLALATFAGGAAAAMPRCGLKRRLCISLGLGGSVLKVEEAQRIPKS